MQQNVDTDPNPSTWRQIATGIAREYMLPHLLEEGKTTSADIAAHHSTAVSRAHYSRNGGDIPTLPNDVVCEQRAAGHAWHDIVGVGENDPPLPIRLIGQATPSTYSASELRRIVQEVVRDTLISMGEPSGGSQASVANPPPSDSSRPLHEDPSDDAPEVLGPSKASSPTLQAPPCAQRNPPSSQRKSPRAESGNCPEDIDVEMLHSEPAEVISIPSSSDEVELVSDDSFPSSRPSQRLGKRSRTTPPSDDEEDEGSPQSSDRSRHLVETRASSLSLDSMVDFIDDSPGSPPHTLHCQSTAAGKRPDRQAPNVGKVLVHPSSSLPVDNYEGFRAIALQGLRDVFNDPTADFKSQEQANLIVHILSCSNDVFGVLPTGGGKSAAWQVTAKVQPDVCAIVVIPYVLPLSDQLQSNIDKGIPSWKYRVNVELPLGTQHVFCQPEQYVTTEFQK